MFIYFQLEEELFKASYVLSEGDAAAFLPSKSHGMFGFFLCQICDFTGCLLVLMWLITGGFLRMFLGPINVRANRKDVQLKVKEEYNSFRVCVPNFDFYFFSGI